MDRQMDIFKDYQQAVRYAYQLEARPGEASVSHNTMVKLALKEAGADVPGSLVDGVTLLALATFGVRVLDVVATKLAGEESAALVAHFSQDWTARRAAADALQMQYRISIGSIDDPRLIDRLVARHYLAERERHRSWALGDIAAEFKASISRLTEAARTIERIDAELQERALATLAAHIELPILEEVYV